MRGYLADIVVAAIQESFEDHGFPPADVEVNESGVRRGMARRCEASVDWTDPDHLRRVADAYSVLLRRSLVEPDEVRRDVERYGWTVTDDKDLRPLHSAPFIEGTLSDLDSAEVVMDHLRRQARNVEDDPKAAIGASKELIESTAKIVLRAENQAVPADFPGLVAAVEKVLLVHAKSDRGSLPDLETGFRTILQGLHQIALGVNLVRGTDRSTGHGYAERLAGLQSRHARLVIGAAHVWCQTIFETHADPHAPWRANQSALKERTVNASPAQ